MGRERGRWWAMWRRCWPQQRVTTGGGARTTCISIVIEYRNKNIRPHCIIYSQKMIEIIKRSCASCKISVVYRQFTLKFRRKKKSQICKNRICDPLLGRDPPVHKTGRFLPKPGLGYNQAVHQGSVSVLLTQLSDRNNKRTEFSQTHNLAAKFKWGR